MTRGVNKVILVGTLGNDPDVKQLSNGNSVANLSLATNESWKDKTTGEIKEKVEWHRVSVFGKLADVVKQYLTKGSHVYFEGKLQTRKWTDQNSVERYSTEVVVDMTGQMQMLSPKAATSQSPDHKNSVETTLSGPKSTPPTPVMEMNDSVPF